VIRLKRKDQAHIQSKMADSVDSLTVFEKRIEHLENRVFGNSNKDAHYPRVCIYPLPVWVNTFFGGA